MQMYFAGSIPDNQWRPLLAHCLEKADSFVVHMPDGPGMLSYGREQFSALPRVTVKPWPGMKGAIEISGELSARPRELFWTIETSLTEYNPEEKLWDYQLLQDGEEILRIGDFSDLSMGAAQDGLAEFESLGIDITEWFPW